jgi:small subunit ribosomal protein S20
VPVTKSAKKKLKIDKKRESANKKVRTLVEITIKKAEKTPTPKSVQNAFSVIDKAVKNKLIHKNKASRIKSRLSKLLGKKTGVIKKLTTTKPKKPKKPSKKPA